MKVCVCQREDIKSSEWRDSVYLPEKRKPVPELVPAPRFGLDQGLLQVQSEIHPGHVQPKSYDKLIENQFNQFNVHLIIYRINQPTSQPVNQNTPTKPSNPPIQPNPVPKKTRNPTPIAYRLGWDWDDAILANPSTSVPFINTEFGRDLNQILVTSYLKNVKRANQFKFKEHLSFAHSTFSSYNGNLGQRKQQMENIKILSYV